jgi:hypothetical protein
LACANFESQQMTNGQQSKLMNDIFKAFRDSVFGLHLKIPWAVRLHQALSFVAAYPQFVSVIGLIPAGPKSFLINSHVCSTFFGMKRNSLNRNLQDHGFLLEPKADIEAELCRYNRELRRFARHWSKRMLVLGPFNPKSAIGETSRATDFPRHTPIHEALQQVQEPKEDVSENLFTEKADGALRREENGSLRPCVHRKI